MYIPFDAATDIHPQDDSLLDREPWDFKNTPVDRYPLLLFYHPLNMYRHQVIKQADVLLALFLFGHEVPLETKKRNFDFYDALTWDSCHPLSKRSWHLKSVSTTKLSPCKGSAAHGSGGCRRQRQRWMPYRLDGGTWMVFAYGFAGLRDHDGVLSFQPHPPESQSTLKLFLTYRGNVRDIEINPELTTYSLREGERLAFRHRDEHLTLNRANPPVTRPTQQPLQRAG